MTDTQVQRPRQRQQGASPRPGGTGHLTRERVLVGAVALADEIGIEEFTMRRLAASLGVKPMTIYHHVPGKEQIIDGIIDMVFAEIVLPPRDQSWTAAMRAALPRLLWPPDLA